MTVYLEGGEGVTNGRLTATYDPTVSPAKISIDADRAREWIKTGAQPTETVRALLKKVDVL